MGGDVTASRRSDAHREGKKDKSGTKPRKVSVSSECRVWSSNELPVAPHTQLKSQCDSRGVAGKETQRESLPCEVDDAFDNCGVLRKDRLDRARPSVIRTTGAGSLFGR